jgi:hypothetical protein
MKYTGTYFGAEFINHVYPPTQKTTEHLLNNFKHKYSVGDWVRFREPHKRTDDGTIKEIAYSSEKNGGGTIKVYKLRDKWIYEGYIKGIIK